MRNILKCCKQSLTLGSFVFMLFLREPSLQFALPVILSVGISIQASGDINQKVSSTGHILINLFSSG